MLVDYLRTVTFHFAVLKGAAARLRDHEEGMTTIEVLVIAAGLVALAGGMVVMLVGVAGSKTGGFDSPTLVISTS